MDRISRQKSPTSGPCCRMNRRARRTALSALVLGVAVNVSCVALASAQDDSPSKPSEPSTAAPMPPARPPALAAPEVPVASAPIQPPEAKVTTEPAVPVWKPGKLLQLPPYTRARMHECALEWQKMKAQGTVAEKIWFTFAQSCLVR